MKNIDNIEYIIEGIIKENNYKKQIQDVNVTQQIKNMTLTIMSTFIEDGYLLENMEQLIVLINNKFIDYQNKYLDTNKIDFFKVIHTNNNENIEKNPIIKENIPEIKILMKNTFSKESLKNTNIEDYNYCVHIINEWKNKSDVDKKKYLINQIQYLSNLRQPEQRSQEWYDYRNGMLTASDLYKAIGTEGLRRSLIIKKCKSSQDNPISGAGKACLHGIKYEDIAITIYENIYHTKIKDYGCIKDNQFDIFGASPDGICEEGSDFVGTMLEIKCPTSRKIIKGEVPEMYWKQIQGQLEVCKLWDCHFLECKILECEEDIFLKSQNKKGIIIDIINNISGKKHFIYSKLDLNSNNYKEWIDAELDLIIQNDNISFIKICYWILEDMNCVVVKRDPYWYYSIKPQIQNFWDEVLYYREHGHKQLEDKIKKRKKKNNYSEEINKCIIQSDSE